LLNVYPFLTHPSLLSDGRGETEIAASSDADGISPFGSKTQQDRPWTDAALLADAGIETALLGPIGQGLHSAEEWVEVKSVVDLAHVLKNLVFRLSRGDRKMWG